MAGKFLRQNAPASKSQEKRFAAMSEPEVEQPTLAATYEGNFRFEFRPTAHSGQIVESSVGIGSVKCYREQMEIQYAVDVNAPDRFVCHHEEQADGEYRYVVNGVTGTKGAFAELMIRWGQDNGVVTYTP